MDEDEDSKGKSEKRELKKKLDDRELVTDDVISKGGIGVMSIDFGEIGEDDLEDSMLFFELGSVIFAVKSCPFITTSTVIGPLFIDEGVFSWLELAISFVSLDGKVRRKLEAGVEIG